MDNKRIKRLFHIAISALKKIKQDNEKQGAMGLGEWCELWTGQEGSLWRGNSVGETKMIGTSYEGHSLSALQHHVQLCMFISHTHWFPSQEHISLRAKIVPDCLSLSQPKQDRAEGWVMLCTERTNNGELNVCPHE